MINNLKIHNFQSHKDTCLEFDKGINVIMGQSNQGKTSILRALNWVISNRPSGLAFKSSFSDKKDLCSVILNINNQEITRKKNDNINSYEIGSSVFNTLGNNIPIEVSTAIGMSGINIQTQFERHFLLMDSAGEVGRTINKIVNLEIIDSLISNLNSKVLSINKEYEIKKEELEIIYQKLDKFKDLDFIEDSVNEIIELSSKLNKLKDQVFALFHLRNELNKVEFIINENETESLDLEVDVNSLRELWIQYNSALEVRNAVLEDKNKLIALDLQITKYEDIIALENDRNNLKVVIDNYIEKVDGLKKLKDVIIKFQSLSIKECEEAVEQSENTFNEFMAINGCPVCGRKG